MIGAKPLRIRFSKKDGFIRVYDGNGYYLDLKKYDFIYKRIRYLVEVKSFVGYFFNDYKIKPWHIMLLKPRAYVKSFDGQTK